MAIDILEDKNNIEQSHPAGLRVRAGALLTDYMIISSLIMTCIIITYYAVDKELIRLFFIESTLYSVSVFVAIPYFILQEGSKRSTTLGKYISGLKVTDLQGNNLKYGKAIARFFAATLNHMTALIGYIMVGFRKDKRGLHDLVAGTQVVIATKSLYWRWNIPLVIMVILQYSYVVFLYGTVTRPELFQ